MVQGIRIDEYDDNWSATFKALQEGLMSVLRGVVLGIEHVGSTAVQGLPAKPIIDIDVIIEGDTDLPAVIDRLARLGYVHEGDLGITGRHAFKAPDSAPAHHLYVCAQNNAELQRHLAFRDYLRTHPEVAQAYGALKREAAARVGNDRVAYTEAKRDFIEQVLLQVRSSSPGSCPR